MKHVFRTLLITLITLPLFAGNGRVLKMPDAVPGQYIVMFEREFHGPRAKELAHDLARAHNGKVVVVWDDAQPGMTVRLSAAAAEALAHHPHVRQVEEDHVYDLAAQTNAPWQIDRIDQVNLPLDGLFNYCTSAWNVLLYVVDTGVRKTHREFRLTPTNSTSRVESGYQVPEVTEAPGTADNPCPDPANDCFGDPNCLNAGHGTAVASVAGGLTYGSAKGVTIVPVRVGNCNGKINASWAKSGMKWIIADYPKRGLPAVVNLSFSKYTGPSNDPITTYVGVEDEIMTLFDMRVTVVAAAGNDNYAADKNTPGRMAWGNTANTSGRHTITAGGSTRTDRRWVCGQQTGDTCQSGNAGSNWGDAVDVFAPAAQVTAASIVSDTAVRHSSGSSGTSFSAPLVAARVARLLENSVPGGYDPYFTWAKIQSQASPVMINTTAAPLHGSPNRLLFQPKMVSRYCQ